ncbi:MAG: hypothetical protein CUN53_00150, partial [Phototrophicales bacterium]
LSCGRVSGKDEMGRESNTSGVANPNSAEGAVPGAPPSYVSHTRINPTLLEITLTKELTDTSAANTSNYIFNNGLQAVSVAKKAGSPTTLQITTTTQQQINYTLTMLNLTTTENVTLTGVIQITFEGLPSPAITSVAWKDPSTPSNPLPSSAYGISLCTLGGGGSGSVCMTAPFYNRTALHGVLTGGNATAYSYKIDAGSWSAEAPLSTPLTVSGLSDGFHTIYIRGKHANGYWQSETATDVFTLSWVQDATAPDAAIDPLTYPAAVTASTTFNVRVIGSDVSYFVYCLDNSTITDCSSASWQGLSAAPLASLGYALPIGSYPANLQPGAVTIRVRGIDASGNLQASVGSLGQYSWVVDTGTVEAIFNSSDIAAITTTGTTVSVRVTNVGGAVSYRGKVVSGTDCNTPPHWNTLPEITNLSTPITASGLSGDGAYYTVCAIGKSLGNQWQGGWSGGASANVVTKYSWIVDTQAPTANFTLLTDPYELPSTPTAITHYEWQVSTSGGVTHYRYAVVSGTGTPCSGATYSAEAPVATPIVFDAATSGVNTYKLCVIARDAAGNYQPVALATASAEWTVDKEPPANNPSFTSTSQAARIFSVPVIQFDIDNGTAPSDAYYYKVEVSTSPSFSTLVSSQTVYSCRTSHPPNCPSAVSTKTVFIAVDPFTQGSVYARVQAGDQAGNYRTDYSATSGEHYVVGKIRGVVRNTAGTPVSGITVRMRDSDGSSLSSLYPDQTTNASGQFTFSNVRTAKNRYRVVAAMSDATYRPAMKRNISVQEEGTGGTIATDLGLMTLVAQSATTPQNIVGKIVDAEDGWMLGYAQVRLIDWQGNVVGSAVRTVYSSLAGITDCDTVPPVGDPPTNIPKMNSAGGGICGDFVFSSVTPGTYSVEVTGNSWGTSNQTYNNLLQEDVVVPGPEEARFLIPRANGATGSSVYDPAEHKMRSGPTISGGAAIGDGAHIFAISAGSFNGKFLLVRGSNSNVTRVFNPVDNSSSLAGPTLSANAGAGAHSFTIPSGTHNGKVLIVHGNSLSSTTLYDPATHSVVAGPALTGNAGAGAHAFSIPSGTHSGKILVVHGNSLTTTSLYDPATHTFTAGPTLPAAAGTGAFSFAITSGTHAGKIRVVRGGSTNNTAVYDPALHTFAAGSTLAANAAAGAMVFRIQSGTHAGKDLVIHGGGVTTTSLYDPATDSFGTGPALTAAAGAGASNFRILSGTHAGKQFIVLGNNTATTNLYDPAAHTFSAGLTLSGGAVSTGSFALQLTSVSKGRMPLVRTLSGQDLKIVLSWGDSDPIDLDLHVVGTLPSGQTVTNVNNDDCGSGNNTLFHVWAGRPNVGYRWAQQYSSKTRTYIQGDPMYDSYNYFPLHPDTTTALVQDTTTGFGPEAINFIGGYTDGTYWFSVANWSQHYPVYYSGADKFNQQWDVTNVELRVYDATGLAFQMVAAAPASTSDIDFSISPAQSGCSSHTDWQQCELWRAFKMQVSGTGPASRIFTPMNKYANFADASGHPDENKCVMGNW